MFDYNTFVGRNIGFVTEDEQLRLKRATVLVVGVGGMGGTALACLARAGISNFIITDIDTFELSNLNRQIFSKMSTIDKDKAEVAKAELLEINSDVNCRIIKGNWQAMLDEVLPEVDVVLNGCDDVRATIHMMRKAKEHGKTVVDAYASTLPSVYVVKPNDPRPEVFMDYPSVGREPESLSDDEAQACAAMETEWVMVNSNTARHVVLDKAAEMITGKRKRISFAPMVWTTGTLMAYEIIKVILGDRNQASYKGFFYNPYTMSVEKPVNPAWAWIKRKLVRAYLNKMKAEQQ